MAGQEVTFDKVSAAAKRLQDDGGKVNVDAVREALGAGSPIAIQKHLQAWRAGHATPPEAPKAELPEPLLAALSSWARQFAEEAGAGDRTALAQSESDLEAMVKSGEDLEAERDDLRAQLASVTVARDQALATITDLQEDIKRLTTELRDARQVATNALVGKAKDQLAIEGKDGQLSDLRAQIERNVAASASESDARLTAEMELIGAATARDNFAAEIKSLHARLDTALAERSTLRVEVEALRAAR